MTQRILIDSWWIKQSIIYRKSILVRQLKYDGVQHAAPHHSQQRHFLCHAVVPWLCQCCSTRALRYCIAQSEIWSDGGNLQAITPLYACDQFAAEIGKLLDRTASCKNDVAMYTLSCSLCCMHSTQLHHQPQHSMPLHVLTNLTLYLLPGK